MTWEKNSWKYGLFFLLGAAVLGGCKGGIKISGQMPPEVMIAEAPPMATVTKVSIQDRVIVSGNIDPYKSRNLGFSSSEKITAIEVVEGERVTKGRVLARIDTSKG